MEKQTYTKLSNLVNDEFTVVEAGGWQFKRWNNEAKRMEVSDKYQDGFRKMYTIKTDKGVMDLGAGQLGNLLEITYYKGVADINGKTFSVKSNGKTGMDIRYYFNVKKEDKPDGDGFKKFQEAKQQLKQEVVLEDIGEEIDLSSVPF